METPTATRPVEQQTNGLAIAALVLGIVGTVFGLVPITALIALACGFTGLALGVIAWRRWRTHGRRAMSIIGVVLSVLAITLGIVGMVIVNDAVDDLDRDLDRIEQEYNTP